MLTAVEQRRKGLVPRKDPFIDAAPLTVEPRRLGNDYSFYSRGIVAWSIDATMTESLVLGVLRRAIREYAPGGSRD